MDRGLSSTAGASSVSADPFTGSSTYAIPIEVPPGTGGMAPTLMLRYSSASSSDAWVGAGWSLDLPTISRSLKRGTPSYNGAQSTFVFSGQELVLISASPTALPAEYRTRRDTFVRIVHEVNGSWTVTQKDGTRLRFGTTPDTRINADVGLTFAWLLESAIDRNRNAFAVTYQVVDGTPYPMTIDYGLRDPGTGVLQSLDNDPGRDRRVEFELEPRDDVSESFLAGFERVMTRRLAKIHVWAAGDLIRRYILRYEYSPDSFRSLLAEVELQGANGSASPFVTSFTYQSNVTQGTTGWTLDTTWQWPSNLPLVNSNDRDEGVRLGDVDGDGLPDLIKAFANFDACNPSNPACGKPALVSSSGVYLNLGNGWSATAAGPPWTLPEVHVGTTVEKKLFPFFSMRIADRNWGSGKAPIDLTGDGRVDLIQSALFLNPNGQGGDEGVTMLDDTDPDDNPFVLVDLEYTAPWWRSSETGWVETGPPVLPSNPMDYNQHPGAREGWLGVLAFSSQEPIVVGGMSRFADLDGDGLQDWVVRGTRSVHNEANTQCIGGAYTATRAPVATVAANHVMRNLGELVFELLPLTISTLTIPASPGGQNPSCPAAPYIFNSAWQVCDPRTASGCADLLFYNRGFLRRDTVQGFTGTYWVVKRQLELGNELVDVNTDGLADQVSSYMMSGDLVQAAHINNGVRAFLRDDAWVLPYELYKIDNTDEYSTDKGARFADVNGDGRLDLAVARSNPGGGSTRQTYLNDGDVAQTGDPGAWRLSTHWTLPENFQTASGADRGIRLVDVNGDGMVDILEGRGGDRKVYLNDGSVPDLLTEVDNSLGGTTSITYGTSTEFDNTGDDDVSDLPQVIPVVTRLSVNPGTGPSSVVDFSYEGGRYDASDREFRGFASVISTRSDGRTTTTSFLQEVHNAGLVDTFNVEASNGDIVDHGAFSYTPDDDGLPPYTTLPATVIRADGFLAQAGLPRVFRTDFEYDDGGPIDFGNRTAIVEWGEINLFGGGNANVEDDRTREFAYNQNGTAYLVDRVSVQRLKDWQGNVVQESSFFYDGDTSGSVPPGAGNLTKRLDVLGEAGEPDPFTLYTYDEYGNMTSVKDPRANAGQGGGITTVEYDGTFHTFPTAIENALGHRREYSYAPPAECTGITAGAMQYPEGGGLVQVERGPNEIAAGSVRWLRCYDAYGRLVFEQAPASLSQLRRVHQDTFMPASGGQPFVGTSRQDILLIDSVGNEAASETFVDGLSRTYRLESDGPQGQQVVVDTTYDALGRVSLESLPHFPSDLLHARLFYEYDALDRVTDKKLSQFLNLRLIEHFDYDAGWVTSTDANGRQSRRLRDPFGRVLEVGEVSSDGNTTTTYAYDARDLLVSVVDHGGNKTMIEYDALGRRRSIDDPDSGSSTFEYDANGNLVRRDDANGDFVTWLYDALDRTTSQRLNGAAGDDVTWSYDTAARGVGLLRGRADRVGAYGVGNYDLLGRPQTERWTVGGKNHDFDNSYTRGGKLYSRKYPGTPRRSVYFLRDAKGILTALRSSDSGNHDYISGITWDAQGRLQNWTTENGVATTLTYGATRLEMLRVDGAVTLEHLDYQYDLGDRITGVLDLRSPSLGRSYTYDDRDRLKSAVGPYGPAQASASLHYRYDALGNLTCKESGSAVTSGTPSACTNAGGKPLVYPTPGQGVPRPHAATQVGSQAAAYDDAGNLESLGSRGFEYNPLGQLQVARQSGAIRAQFTYDGAGRLGRILDQSGASAVDRYLLASDFEWNKTAQLARIHIQLGGLTVATHEDSYIPPTPGGGCASMPPALTGVDSSDGPAALGMLLANVLVIWLAWCLLWNLGRRPRGARGRAAVAMAMVLAVLVFTSLPEPLGTGRPAWAAFTGNVVYYHGDVLGSSVLTTDQTGAVVQRANYKPYGELANAGSPPEFGFTGERFVAAAGIYDYGARWYDPTLGRFLQPDSLVPEPFDPQSLNRYSYVVNNPVGRIDPTGNWSFELGYLFGTLGYSTGLGFDWGWGDYGLGASFSTLNFDDGLGFSLMLGGDTDISAWAFGNTFGFGFGGSGGYLTSPFGSLGSEGAVLGRANEANAARAGRLGRLGGEPAASLIDNGYVTSRAGEHGVALYDYRLGKVFVGDNVMGPYAEARSALWHEYAHAGLDRAGIDDFLDQQVSGFSGSLTVQGMSGKTYDTNPWEAAAEYLSYRDQLRNSSGYIPSATEFRFDRDQYRNALSTIDPGLPGRLEQQFPAPMLPIPRN